MVADITKTLLLIVLLQQPQVLLHNTQLKFPYLISSCLFTAVQSLNSLNDQIAQFMVPSPCSLPEEDDPYVPGQRDNLRQSMTLMRHLLMDAQVREKGAKMEELCGVLNEW